MVDHIKKMIKVFETMFEPVHYLKPEYYRRFFIAKEEEYSDETEEPIGVQE